MLLIGLSGKKGVGKNFVADRIVEYAKAGGMTIEVAAFAGPLKEFCIEVLGLSREACYGNDQDKNAMSKHLWANMPAFIRGKYKKSGNMTQREVLQVFGTDFIRDCWDKEAWVNAMARRILASKADIFIITDLRFPNEADVVKGMGGHVWVVDGPQRGDESKKNDTHASETEMSLIEPTCVIRNELSDDAQSILDKVADAIEVADPTMAPKTRRTAAPHGGLAALVCLVAGALLTGVYPVVALLFLMTGAVISFVELWTAIASLRRRG